MFDTIEKMQELYHSMRVVDLSPMLERGIPKFPSHPHVIIDPTVYHEKDGYYCQTLCIGEHDGCHVDAPYHVHAELPEKTIEIYSPDKLTGKAVVYHFSDRELKPGEQLTAQDFLDYEKKNGVAVGRDEIALIDFGWQKYWKLDAAGNFYSIQSPGMTEDACKLLYDRGIKAVGCDNIACDQAIVDGVSKYAPGHANWFLPKDILIMEEMSNLTELPLICFLIAVPLKTKRGSGSPIRPYALVEK